MNINIWYPSISILDRQTDPFVAKAQNFIRGEATTHTFLIIGVGEKIYWEGGTPHILC